MGYATCDRCGKTLIAPTQAEAEVQRDKHQQSCGGKVRSMWVVPQMP